MANPYDKVLSEKKLNYEDLTPAEKRLYDSAGRSAKPVAPEELLEHLEEALFATQLELCDTPDSKESQDKNIKLKARIKNYLILKGFLEAPLKMAKAIERSIEQ